MIIYYTDVHDVDENERTSSIYGGEYSPGVYPNGTVAGVFTHFVERALDSAAPSVASRKNKQDLLTFR